MWDAKAKAGDFNQKRHFGGEYMLLSFDKDSAVLQVQQLCLKFLLSAELSHNIQKFTVGLMLLTLPQSSYFILDTRSSSVWASGSYKDTCVQIEGLALLVPTRQVLRSNVFNWGLHGQGSGRL